MAKDGTSRGGARPGAGRKKKALSEKIAAGNPGHRPLKMLDPVAIDTVDMPPPAEYLSAEQRDGRPLGADKIYIKNSQLYSDRSAHRVYGVRLQLFYIVATRKNAR